MAFFISNLFSADTLPLQSKTKPTNKDSASIVAPKTPSPNEDPTVMEPGRPVLGSVDTYGSKRINEVVLRELLGKELDTWIAKGLASDPTAVDLEKKNVKKIKDKFGFPYAEWSVVEYFDPGQVTYHLTLDVVEADDVARRMSFLELPKEQLADPGGLLALWEEYEEVGLKLVGEGKLEPDTEKCKALHCPFGHRLSQLKKYEKPLLEGAKKFGPALLETLRRDSRPEYRAAAVYVLAYWVSEKNKVASALVEQVRDSDSVVRNNILRVLGDIAQDYKEVVIPATPILPLLDFPRVSDRSKALYVVYLLSMTTGAVREQILRDSFLTLVSLMECKQPDHKELAHQILRKISGKEFPAEDSRAWLAWYRKLPQSKEVSKK